ncbi:hypothetical protein R3P38DRAFT_3444296 [Favolaschia claudopus]|uniref:Nephrocystin 3-like N-terminal domain-containing protein n=1 Tax=Favolaschia claudopus TaxID=2862362 RepID=A0AAV9ZP14_9AGAR
MHDAAESGVIVDGWLGGEDADRVRNPEIEEIGVRWDTYWSCRMYSEILATDSTGTMLSGATHITAHFHVKSPAGARGGPGGPGVRYGGQGGSAQGPVVKADNVNFYALDPVLAYASSLFAPMALFNADAANGESRRACTPGTRVDLMSRLQQWALDTSPDSSPIFWLSGLTGTGKSTVAYTLCDVDKCFANSVRDVVFDHVIPDPALHVPELLITPWLRSRAETHSSLVVVIDALDEIEGSENGPHFIKQIIQACSMSEPRFCGLKFFVTSRPHPHIVEECNHIKGSAVYRMEQITAKEAFDDVERFIDTELSHLNPADRKDITTKSAGLFIFAATVVRHLRPPNLPLSRIQQKNRLKSFDPTTTDGEHPSLIASLYREILAQVFSHRGSEVEMSCGEIRCITI